MVRIAPQLFAIRSEIQPGLHKKASVFSKDTTKPEVLEELRQAIIQEEQSRSRFGGF